MQIDHALVSTVSDRYANAEKPNELIGDILNWMLQIQDIQLLLAGIFSK